jgi:hypothetical protein
MTETTSQGVVLRGARASSAVVCTRRAVYDHQAAPKRPPTDDEVGWWKRGTIIEAVVPWPREDPIGEGHADLWIPDQRHVVEVSSNTGAELQEHKAIQAALYARNLQAETAEVFAVDASCPTRYRRYPIDLAGLEPRIIEIENEVVLGVITGNLPDRTCRHPDDGPAFQCPYRETCFADWQWPDVATLEGHLDLVEALADAEDLVGTAKQLLATAEEARAAARDALRPLLEPGVRSKPPGFKSLKRSVIPGRRSFSLSAWEKTGHPVNDEMAEFVTQSEPSERWTITRDEETRNEQPIPTKASPSDPRVDDVLAPCPETPNPEQT